ncbi:MAG: glycerol-3-phosphate acyltransferase [Candidatus Falkowbacteria bacterium]|nr:glycerol-3-phosphate acyltransferase [Candidatus Falkowbacteria bacterium]
MNLVLLIVISYLVGSIPTGWIFTKLSTGRLRDKDKAKNYGPLKNFFIKFKNGHDIRHHGSKNPGATNVWRVLGRFAGSTVGVIDIAKAFVLVLVIAPAFSSGINSSICQISSGIVCILGNTFPVWFRNFKGGKAVAAATGVFAGLMPLPLIFAFLVWLIMLWWKGIVSLASISASLALLAGYLIYLAIYGMPVFGAEDWPKTIFAMLLVVFIFITHRSNIKRLLNGEENSFKVK